MRTSEERIAELHHRMDALKRAKALRRYRLTCAAACTAALFITVLMAWSVSRLPVQASDAASGSAAASVFSGHPALGYVVAALAALCLGVLVTIFCFRLKRRMMNGDTGNDRKH